jgi:hypothetical protein
MIQVAPSHPPYLNIVVTRLATLTPTAYQPPHLGGVSNEI